MNGFLGCVLFLLFGVITFICVSQFVLYENIIMLVLASFCAVVTILLLSSFTVIQPNPAKVFTLFGSYFGVIRHEGFWSTVPLTSRKTVSLRVINFNSDKL